MRKNYTKSIQSVVIKVGTSILTQDGRFDRRIVTRLADEISRLVKKGVRVSVVSSGAIGAGMTLLGLKKRPTAMEGLQAAAAAGQRYLMQCYEEAFSRRGFSTAQVLLTWDDLAERKRFTNARRTLDQIHAWGLVPVINENDTVATDEIRFGDNDRLSSLLAVLIEADALVILSNTDGLYESGGKGSRIRLVENMGSSIFSHVRDRKTSFTVGGMHSKLKAVETAVRSGIPVFLADGRVPGILGRIFAAEDVGTFFMPQKTSTRRNWASHFTRQVKR